MDFWQHAFLTVYLGFLLKVILTVTEIAVGIRSQNRFTGVEDHLDLGAIEVDLRCWY
jgi:hypothetical protein